MANVTESSSVMGLTSLDIDNLTLKLCRMTDDDLFQSNLITTLKPIILEISKANTENRSKLFELLVHINNRIRAIKHLKMPLEPFIDLLNNSSLQNQIHSINLAHMYVKICFPKYDQETRVRLLPLILASLTENKNQSQKDILLHVVMSTFQYVKISADPAPRKPFELINLPYQRKYIIEFLSLILLTPYNYKVLIRDGSNSAGTTCTELHRYVPDGMSQHDFSRVIKPDIPGSFVVNDDLEKLKCGIAQFLVQRFYPDEEIVAAICLGHSDTRHSVVSIIDREAKLIYSQIDWEKLDVLNLLLDWYIPSRNRPINLQKPATNSQSQSSSGMFTRLRLPIAALNKMGTLLMRSKISLPNKLALALAEAASVTFLNSDSNADARTIHPKQVETGFALVAQLCAFCSDMTDEISKQLLKDLIIFMKKPLAQHESNLKVKALNLIPQVLKRNHRFLLQDTNYLSQLFDSLCNSNNDPEIKEAIKDCLRSIAIILQTKNVWEDSVASAVLEAILYLNFNKEEEECRRAVVYFAGLVYSSVHIPTRFLLLEALGDQSKLVREEAEHVFGGLFTPSAQHDIVTRKVKLPCFVDLVNYHGHLYNRNLFSDPVKLIPVVEYIRMCILSLDVGLTESMQRELLYDNPDDYRFRIYRNIQYFVKSQENQDSDLASAKALEMYCKLVQVIYYTKNYFMNFLEEIIAVSPKILPTKEGIILHRTKNLMVSDCQDEMFNRQNCASVHALLALEMEDDEALEINLRTMVESIPSLVPKQLLLQKSVPMAFAYHGNAFGFSFLLERIVTAQRKVSSIRDLVITFLNKIDPVFTATSITGNSAQELASSPGLVFGSLLETLSVLFECLFVICQSGALAFLPAGKFTEQNIKDESIDGVHDQNKAFLAKRALSYLRNSSPYPIRIKESALRVLSSLAMGENNFVHSQSILEVLMQTHSTKDPFLHKTIGQSIVSIIMGPNSPYRGRWYERQFCEQPPMASVQKSGANSKKSVTMSTTATTKDLLQMVMNQVHEVLLHGNSISRHNVALWTVFLVQKLSWHASMSLPQLHSRILVVLGDKEEMAQDAAACVLGVIYDQSSPNERKLMAEELIQVILHGKRGRLMENVESSSSSSASSSSSSSLSDRFTDAELESRESNRATYKELCSLANELNQPDLIYSFMPLAAVGNYGNGGKWSLKAGASIGMSYMLLNHQGHRDLEPHISKIVPKLFRYRFDPHPRTQKTMEQIWSNLGVIAPNQELIKTCFSDIVTELLHGLANEQSRVRESCCHALRSLLKHETADPLVLNDIGPLVRRLLRVMDDAKVENRAAAIEAANGVERFCTMVLGDPARRQSVEPLLSSLVPVLLEQGLPSKLPQVQKFALNTLGHIVHTGRNDIRRVIPTIVISVLQAMSSLENSHSNVISQHLEGMGNHDSRERWDMQRVTMSKHSPLSEILSGCIRYIEDDTQEQLLVPLADIVRHGVGLATKCGTAEFLIDLSQHCGSRLMGATGKLLAALLYAVLDKNEVVQREMAKAIGCLVKFSKKSSVEKLFVITRTWYFDHCDYEEHQLACCYVYQYIEKYAPGTLEMHGTITLPLIFLAKQNEPETTNDSGGAASTQKKLALQTESCQKRRIIWSQTWVECVRSEGSVVMEMMPHILACVEEALNKSHFHLRTQGTLSLMALVRTMGRQCSADDISLWNQLYSAILNSFLIKNKFWAGKVYLLYATMSFVRQLDENGLLKIIQDRHQLIEILMKETSKTDLSYRCIAFEAVAKVSDILDNECLTALLPLMSPLIVKGENQVAAPEQDVLLRVVGHMWPKSSDDAQKSHFVSVIQLLTQAMEESQWKQQIAVLKSFKSLFKKTSVTTIKKLLDPEGDQYHGVVKCLRAMFKSWKRVPEMVKYKQLRESCLDAVEILINSSDIFHVFKEQLKCVLQCFTNDCVPSIKEKAVTLSKMVS